MAEQRKPFLTGGCQCGAVRYALYAEPERASICHCRMCQKALGNAFAPFAAVRLDDFRWTRGNPSIYLIMGTQYATLRSISCSPALRETN
jgi:hypothetical protein